MTNLKIVFSGLCGFVFDKPLVDLKQTPTRATVLLPQLLLPRLLNGHPGSPPEILDAHYPQLVFDLDSVKSTSGVSADYTNRAAGKGLILLFERELSILPDSNAAANGLKLLRNQPANWLSNNVGDLQSLLWMVDLAEALPSSGGRVNPGQVQQSPAATGDVIAKVHVASGTLSNFEVSPFELSFDPPGDPNFKRRIATKILLEVPVTSTAVIVMTNRDGSQQRLELVPGKGDFRIDICNLEIDNFFGMPSDLVYPAKSTAPDFEAFYDMSAGFVAGGKVPSLNFVPGFQSIHGGLCPPVAFSEI